MSEENFYRSWMIKPCSDGVSTDIRPPKRYQIDLASLNRSIPDNFKKEIITNNLAILYDENDIKITLYQSGRMLIDTRDQIIASSILKAMLDFFGLT